MLRISHGFLILAIFLASGTPARGQVKKDVPYVPTPEAVVNKMLEMVDVKPTDVVYDLGCGDGRIVVTAAKKFGATGVGVDIDPERIKESNENARKAGVTDKVKFINQDLFKMDFSEATVVTLYLLPSVNQRLRPTILELKPGTRIVSHAFDMRDWKHDARAEVDGRDVYFWVVPAKVDGTWKCELSAGGPATLQLKQKFQEVSGTLSLNGKEAALKETNLRGDRLQFTISEPGQAPVRYVCQVSGDKLEGEGKTSATGAQPVKITAQRQRERAQ